MSIKSDLNVLHFEKKKTQGSVKQLFNVALYMSL